MDEKELYERITRVEESVKSAHKRLNEIQKLTESVSQMVIEVKHMREDVNSLDSKIQAMEQAPKDRADTWTKAFISAIAGGIIGYFLKQLGII